MVPNELYSFMRMCPAFCVCPTEPTHSKLFGFCLQVLFRLGQRNQWCKSLLSTGGDNLQFYPNFALFSTLEGMNLDQDFFQVSKLSEDQKKRSLPKMEHFFSRIQVKTKKKKVFTRNGTLFFSEFR